MFYAKDLVVFSDRHKREHNEDRAFYLHYDGRPDLKSSMTIFAVLDGVSNSNGSQASRLASSAMLPCLSELLGKADVLLKLDDETKKAEILRMLRRAILDADACLRHHQENGLDLGTTITLAVVFDEAVFTANIGDSPCFLLRLPSQDQPARLLPMFECHNKAGSLVREGQLTPEEALHSQARNMLMRMVGGSGIIGNEIATASAWLSSSDVLLLGSDGALAVLTDTQLTELVTANLPNGLHSVVAALFDAVQKSTSTDNFTVLAQWLETT